MTDCLQVSQEDIAGWQATAIYQKEFSFASSNTYLHKGRTVLEHCSVVKDIIEHVAL